MSSGWAKNLSLALGAAAFALGVAELVVRFTVPVRNVGPSFTTYDSVYGKRLKPSFHATRYTPEFTNKFTTNSLGFRGPEPVSPPTHGLLFMGDSYTMGYGVSDGEEFPELVRHALLQTGSTVPVINAGMGDNGNGRWVKFLRHELGRLKPRTVILQISENDFGDNVKEGLFTLDHSGDLTERPLPSPGISRTIQEVIELVPGLAYSYLVGLSRQATLAGQTTTAEAKVPGSASDNRQDPADTLTYKLVARAVEICQAAGSPVVALEVGVEGPRLGALRKMFQDSRIELIEVPTKSVRPDLYYRIDGHWNSKGHRWVADKLLGQLRSRRQLDTSPNASRELSTSDGTR